MLPHQRSVIAWMLVAFSVSGLAVVTTAPANADASSAVTKNGTGAFSGVAFTVAQTQHLKNEVVRVSWTGAHPTSGNFDINYMQVMQCWGDGPVPLRENCQFGAFGNSGDPRGGANVTTRAVTDSQYKDPLETLKAPNPYTQAVDPFAPVGGTPTTQFPNPYFDRNSTNEEPFGRTGADGTGQVFFEVQTGAQAPGLGCGQPEADGSIRNCWLVIVPRGTKEVDGSSPSTLITSPLAQTNWNNAVSFRLNFDSLAVTCPIGINEHQMIGQEPTVEAITSWQPALCGAVGSPFSYTESTDNIARAQTLRDDPWMAMVSRPIDPSLVTDGRRLTYAPIALGALGVAFNIDVQPKYGAPASVQQQAGQRVASLKLNARLVAKLLTQSYWAASRMNNFPAQNAEDLTRDPEFRALNPEFVNYQFSTDIYQILVPQGLSDAYGEVWQWIGSDPDAAGFISGKPDPWGMVVNPNYKNLDLTRSDFPRADLACRSAPYPAGPVCPADLLAYAADMHDATRGTSRGDALARTVWDLGKSVYAKPPLQLSGQRDILALTDAATASLYSLPLATLENGAREFVAPTKASVLAGLGAMTPSSTPGVLTPNPGAGASGVYPLTHLTYAVTSPDHLTGDEASAYSKFLTYVAGPGQVPGVGAGQLPPGYVPLTQSLVEQVKTAAATIAAGPQPSASDSSPSDSPSEPTTSPSTQTATAATTASAPTPVAVPSAAPSATAEPSTAADAAPAAYKTPADATNGMRYAVVLALSFSLVAGLAWLIVPMLARRGPPAT